MAVTNSAKKRHRQSIKRRMRNRIAKSKIRTAIRQFMAQLENNEKEAAEKSFRLVRKLLDTAGGKGILHKGFVNRKKSRLAKRLNTM